MSRWAVGVEYLGTAYCGWQTQGHCPAIQEEVEKALSFVAGVGVVLTCAGRTDTGVHALGQVAHFDAAVERKEDSWIMGANSRLPADIRIKWVKQVAENFHARFSAVERRYIYAIYNQPVNSAVLAGRVAWERLPLDVELMHQAAQSLVGEQDFSSFRAAECQAQHAIREVKQVGVYRKNSIVFIDITANAFLHHMVRNIVGSLLLLGRGGLPVTWLKTLLELQDRTQAPATAPAQGLYMINAFYPAEFAIPQVEPNELIWH